ncbi:carbohydrate kinase [Priestia aryabhattai]
MKKGIISYGEAFIDFIAKNESNTDFDPFLGGTTVNVAVGVQKLGAKAYYICKLGSDETSDFVRKKLLIEGVNQSGCVTSKTKKVCEVYVHKSKEGDRHFHSYIDSTPHEQVYKHELQEPLFEQAAIFYFGSGTLFHRISQETTKEAVRLAKKYRMLVAFDPNIRMKRWESEAACRNTVTPFLYETDILKISQDELLFLMNSTDLTESLEKLRSYHIPYVWITQGEDGAVAVTANQTLHVSAKEVHAIDTTGAGDAFMAGILWCIHEKGLPESEESRKRYTMFANALGEAVSARYGGMISLKAKDVSSIKAGS